jgi:hypothetical protein
MNLSFLKDLYQGPGLREGAGYVSVYLDTSATEATSAQVALRWRAARKELADAGADDATLDAVAQQLTAQPPGSPGLAVFARAGAVRLVSQLPLRPRDAESRFAPLPHVMPLLAQLAPAAPHVRVAAGRAGARVLACPADGSEQGISVEGGKWPVHKVSTGGWSERHLQRSAEETWAANAKRFAAVTAETARQVHAAYVLVGGDVRERAAVMDALPKACREIAVLVDREADPDSAPFAAAAETENARRQAALARARLDDFRALISIEDPAQRRAVEGLDSTLAALRDGLAASVLLAYDPFSAQEAWVGADPADAAVSAEQLRARGDGNPVPDRADAALARAACGTDAELLFVPPDADPPAGGIGALLRAPAAAL